MRPSRPSRARARCSSRCPSTPFTLEEAVKLLELPRVVGAGEDGEEITAQNGRYGPYLKSGTDSRSLTHEDQIFDITLDQALAIYAQPKQRGRGAAAAPLKELGNDPVSGQPVVVKAGRFGEYVTDGEYNATLRKDDTVESINLERAAELLPSDATRARRRRRPRRARRRRPAKKTTAKKTTAKKTTTKKAAKKAARSPDRDGRARGSIQLRGRVVERRSARGTGRWTPRTAGVGPSGRPDVGRSSPVGLDEQATRYADRGRARPRPASPRGAARLGRRRARSSEALTDAGRRRRSHAAEPASRRSSPTCRAAARADAVTRTAAAVRASASAACRPRPRAGRRTRLAAVLGDDVRDGRGVARPCSVPADRPTGPTVGSPADDGGSSVRRPGRSPAAAGTVVLALAEPGALNARHRRGEARAASRSTPTGGVARRPLARPRTSAYWRRSDGPCPTPRLGSQRDAAPGSAPACGPRP